MAYKQKFTGSRFNFAVDEGDGPTRRDDAKPQEFCPILTTLTEVEEPVANNHCCCTRTWIDKECVSKAIDEWECDQVIFCNGCFMNLENKVVHQCTYYNYTPNQWARMVKESLLQEDRFNELINIYAKQHNLYDIESKRYNFDLALRCLVNGLSVQIGELLCQKDKASFYRLNSRV